MSCPPSEIQSSRNYSKIFQRFVHAAKTREEWTFREGISIDYRLESKDRGSRAGKGFLAARGQHGSRQPLVLLVVERGDVVVVVVVLRAGNGRRRLLASLEAWIHGPVPSAPLQNGNRRGRSKGERRLGGAVRRAEEQPALQRAPGGPLRQPEEELQEFVQVRERERGPREDPAVPQGRPKAVRRRPTLALSAPQVALALGERQEAAGEE